MSQQDLAQRLRRDLRTVQALERGERKSLRVTTLGALDRALRWEAGSAERAMDGGEPTVLRDDSVDQEERAIMESPGLSEDEKRVLLATLRAMRGEQRPGALFPERRRQA